MYSKQLMLKKRGVYVPNLKKAQIRYLSLELYHFNNDIFVIFLVKIEMFDDAVSIFATGSGESDLPFFLQVVEHNL